MHNISKKPIKNLFHDQGYIYISNIEPDVGEPVTVRLRTVLGNVTKAFVEISGNGSDWTQYEMKKEKTDKTGKFEYFIGTVPGQSKMYKYRFLCMNEDPANTVYYARTYIGPEPQNFTEVVLQPDNCWVMNPLLHTPDWAKGVLWYSIMPDCFYNGDPTNDEPFSGSNYSNAWNRVRFNLADKYGGDLKGIIKKLDYVKELGAEAIFMDPVFKSYQNAGYGPEFYKQVENSFGNKAALVELSKNIHDRGMKFIVDVVFSFVQLKSIYYNDGKLYPFPGAQQDWKNKYHDWFWFTGEEGDTRAYKSLWAGIEINHCNEEFCKEIYSGEDAYLPRLLKEPFNFDGFRYDTGGALYGTDKDGKRIGDPFIVGKMRPYLKACNPNAMMMSEYSMNPSMDYGTWDARWNLQFVKEIQGYIDGTIPESEIFRWLDFEVMNIPRAAALCQYFALSDHDRPRNHNREYYAIRPAQIILMTMLGAPCIYYGDEFNIEREDEIPSFYAMDWREQHWDYKTLNFYKALIDMRKKNSCLKSGIVKFISVDDENHIMAFARIDENGTAVTVASHNPHSVRFAFDVNDLGDTDGTVYTDWLTGKRYTAENGFIEAEIMPGGTVLVKGTKSAVNKGEFIFTPIGEAEADVIQRDLNCFEVSGKCGTDGLVFANTDVFNTCKVTAKITGDNCNAVIMIRNSLNPDSAFVAAGIKDGKLYTAARERNGGDIVTSLIDASEINSYLRIERNENNRFTVLTTKIPGTAWEKKAEIYAEINNRAKAGFAVLRGNAVFDGVAVTYDKQPIKYDSFKYGKSAMFDYDDGISLCYSENGLTVTPNGHTELLANSQDEDWTFKTELEYVPEANGYAGIICRQDDLNYVVTGRKTENGSPVFFLGRANYGKLLTYYSVPDTNPTAKVTVQLQRIGTAYSAIFSYDSISWELIGKGLIANYCVEKVGPVVDGSRSAVFTYVCFGDAVNDGCSVNTPRTPTEIAPDYSVMKNIILNPTYEIVKGSWAYANEGYIQTDTGIGQMGISNRDFGDFKADGTYVIDSGEGFIGFEFGKKAYDSELGDGILFCCDNTGNIRLMKDGNIIDSAKLPGGYGTEQRLSAELKDGYFTVFAGEEAEPVMHAAINTERGYIAYFTQGVVGHINSGYIGSNDTCMYCFNPYKFYEDGFRNDWQHTKSFINPFCVAMTDYAVSAEITVDNIWDAADNPYFGIYFSGYEGKLYGGKALNVTVRSNKLMLRDGEKVIKSVVLPVNTSSIALMICKKGNDYFIYKDKSGEPIFTYSDEVLRGGTVTFVSNQLNASFRKVAMTDIQPDESVEATQQFKNWML